MEFLIILFFSLSVRSLFDWCVSFLSTTFFCGLYPSRHESTFQFFVCHHRISINHFWILFFFFRVRCYFDDDSFFIHPISFHVILFRQIQCIFTCNAATQCAQKKPKTRWRAIPLRAASTFDELAPHLVTIRANNLFFLFFSFFFSFPILLLILNKSLLRVVAIERTMDSFESFNNAEEKKKKT